jgi:uncharacterized membrane protein HdeD (DUF308 family)
MSTTDRGTASALPPSRPATRGKLFFLAITAVVLGILAILFPHSALRSISLLVGIYLVVAGILRIFEVRNDQHRLTGRQKLQLVFGALVVTAGVLCLNNPFSSAAALSIVIGAGWMVDGLASLTVALFEPHSEGRWRLGIFGAVNIAVGIAFVVIPHPTLKAFIMLAAVMILILGVSMLLLLITWRPRQA